jgi:hypothetical protein
LFGTDARFLGKPDEIRKVINAPKAIEFRSLTLKPYRNPQVPEENFWAHLQPDSGDESLPLFPFQVLFHDLKIEIDRANLASALGIPAVTDYKVWCDARLYPAGMGTLHFSIYVEAKDGGLLPSHIATFADALPTLLVTVSDRTQGAASKNLFDVLDSLRRRLSEEIVAANADTSEVQGAYYFFTLEGNPLNWHDHVADCARLLVGSKDTAAVTRARKLVRRGIGVSRAQDLLVIGERASIIYVDAGLKAKYAKAKRAVILNGRRCFRQHFTSTVELAYLCSGKDGLIDEYTSRFNKLLADLRAEHLRANILNLLTSAFELGPLSRVAYLTVSQALLHVQDRLEAARKGGFWKRVYLAAAYELDLRREVKALKKTTESLYKQSVEFSDEQVKTLTGALQSIGAGALEVFKAVKPDIKL